MGFFGTLYDYGTPAGWAGQAAKGLGITGKTLGEYGEQGIGELAAGMDRSRRAEGLYGGVGNADLPHFKSQYDQYGGLAQQYGQQGSSFRGGQQQLGQILSAEAQGNGVGQRLVGMQARQAADRASAQQFGAIAGARPGMQAMASRNAMLGSAMAQSAVGEQAALGSAQMTLGAQNAYGQHLQAARGQDIGQQQANNQAQLEAYRQRLEAAQAQQRGQLGTEQLRTQRYAALMGQPTPTETIVGGAVGIGGLLAGM